ncbi:aldo/keto reductase [Mycoplasmatota bacterium WC30]
MMNYRVFGKQKIKISEIGFGGWQLGNNDLWGAMTFEEGVVLVKEAFSKGINFFDTAPGYTSGMSEKIIGDAIHNIREQVFINTKFGHNHLNQEDFSEKSIEKSIDESLERLQTSYLDSVILHNPPQYILEGKTNHQEGFEKLMKKGKIRTWGVSIDSLSELKLVLNNLNVGVIEIMFNINHQSVKEMFLEIKKRGILLITKIPLDSGWLTGKYNENSEFMGIRSRWSKSDINTRGEIVNRIKKIVKNENLVKYALAFILSFDAVTVVIPGIKNSEQLNSNIAASGFILSPDIRIGLEILYDTLIKDKNLPW